VSHNSTVHLYPSSLNVLHNSVLWHHKTKAAIMSYPMLCTVQHHKKIMCQTTSHKKNVSF